MVTYAVWIEKDTNEYDYVRERKGNSWNDKSPVIYWFHYINLFSTINT